MMIATKRNLSLPTRLVRQETQQGPQDRRNRRVLQGRQNLQVNLIPQTKSTAFDEDTEVWEQTWNDGQGQFEYRRINPETNTVFPPDTKGGLGQMLLYDPLHAEECREEAENAFQSYDVDGTTVEQGRNHEVVGE